MRGIHFQQCHHRALKSIHFQCPNTSALVLVLIFSFLQVNHLQWESVMDLKFYGFLLVSNMDGQQSPFTLWLQATFAMVPEVFFYNWFLTFKRLSCEMDGHLVIPFYNKLFTSKTFCTHSK